MGKLACLEKINKERATKKEIGVLCSRDGGVIEGRLEKTNYVEFGGDPGDFFCLQQ